MLIKRSCNNRVKLAYLVYVLNINSTPEGFLYQFERPHRNKRKKCSTFIEILETTPFFHLQYIMNLVESILNTRTFLTCNCILCQYEYFSRYTCDLGVNDQINTVCPAEIYPWCVDHH